MSLTDGETTEKYVYDRRGNLTESYGYDEFGRDLYGNQGKIQPFGYTGYQYDWVSDTYFAQAREYAPGVGRFVETDIIKGFISMTYSLNGYGYCWGNPLKFVDLNGKWTIVIKGALNLTLLFGVNIDIGIAFDDNRNVAIQWSYSVPTVNDTMSIGIADVGAAIQMQRMWNTDTVYDLEGRASSIGVSGGYLSYFGVDLISASPMREMETIDGIQGQIGIGAGLDVHVTESYAQTIASWSKGTIHKGIILPELSERKGCEIYE